MSYSYTTDEEGRQITQNNSDDEYAVLRETARRQMQDYMTGIAETPPPLPIVEELVLEDENFIQDNPWYPESPTDTSFESIRRTILCAQAMGFTLVGKANDLTNLPLIIERESNGVERIVEYNPLKNDAQAMAIVMKLRLYVDGTSSGENWDVCARSVDTIRSGNLKWAIVQVVSQGREMGVL